MSGTFDVGGTDSSTLVNNQSKHEQDTTTTTGEEDKTETADPSAENYDSGDEDDNEDDDNDENGCDGEEEEGIEDSMNQIEECHEDIETEGKDEKSVEDEDDKLISDGSNKKHEENKADVNMANNDNSNNSDDIIPSENTQPEDNNSSITAPTMEKSQSETTQKNGDTKMGQSSTIQSMDIGQTQKSEEGKKSAMKRLGMGGLAFTKRTLQVSMQDISIDSDKSQKTQDQNKMEGGKKSVMRKLMCTKCPEMFFTQEGYQRHLFKDHKVRCFDKHPPQVIEKIVTRCSQETYETNYRVVNKKIPDKGAEAVTNTDTTFQHIDMLEQENVKETLEDDVNVKTKSGEQSKINENDENIENIFVSSEGPFKKNRKGKKRRGKKSHLTSRKKKTVSDQGDEEESESFKRLRKAMQNMYAINKEEPTVKCIGCDIYFYSEDRMRTQRISNMCTQT